MSDTSPNLLFPYVAAGQAQKHVTVNETIQRLDALVQLTVVSATTSVQPASPTDGEVYILPAGKTGASWGGMSNHALAYFRDGVWEQITPREGWLAYAKDADQLLHYGGSAWTLFAPEKVLTLSTSDKILGRVSSGPGAAEEIAFSDPAQALCDDTSFQAMCATLGTWRVLAASAVAAAHTGNTSETTLATIPIPAGAMGPNGLLRVDAAFSFSNSANSKTAILRFGGPSGALFLSTAVTTQGHARFQRLIANRNAANAQVGASHNNAGGFGSAGGAAIATSTINTTSAVDLLIRASSPTRPIPSRWRVMRSRCSLAPDLGLNHR